jgi:hypothetical protein
MNDKAFWSIIARAKGRGGSDAHSQRLVSALVQLSAADIVDFYLQYERHFDLAERGDVWAASLLLNGGYSSDDGFEYFRNWLIGQGRSVYEAALANPDSLADVTIRMVGGRPSAEWESFGYAASEAYATKTNTDLYEDAASRDLHAENLLQGSSQSNQLFDESEYDAAFMRKHLPELWAKYGRYKAEVDGQVQRLSDELEEHAAKAEVEIEGIGLIEAGVVLAHGTFGKGTVLGVQPFQVGAIVQVRFSDGVHSLWIDPDTRNVVGYLESLSGEADV